MQQPLFEEESTPSQKPELVPGTLVVCRYRMPSTIQPWVAPIWVGVIEEPGDDPAQWNGRNSEKTYCLDCKKTRVRWPFGVIHDFTDTLIAITPEEAALTPIEKVRHFLGEEAAACWERVSGPKNQEA